MALDTLPDMALEKMPDGDQRTFRVTVHDDSNQVIDWATLTLSAGG